MWKPCSKFVKDRSINNVFSRDARHWTSRAHQTR